MESKKEIMKRNRLECMWQSLRVRLDYRLRALEWSPKRERTTRNILRGWGEGWRRKPAMASFLLGQHRARTCQSYTTLSTFSILCQSLSYSKTRLPVFNHLQQLFYFVPQEMLTTANMELHDKCWWMIVCEKHVGQRGWEQRALYLRRRIYIHISHITGIHKSTLSQ